MTGFFIDLQAARPAAAILIFVMATGPGVQRHRRVTIPDYREAPCCQRGATADPHAATQFSHGSTASKELCVGPRAAVSAALRDDLVYARNTHLTTGILGTKYLFPLLTATGNSIWLTNWPPRRLSELGLHDREWRDHLWSFGKIRPAIHEFAQSPMSQPGRVVLQRAGGHQSG